MTSASQDSYRAETNTRLAGSAPASCWAARKCCELDAAIGISAVAYVVHCHQLCFVIHSVDDAVVPRSQAIQVLRASQLRRLARKGLCPESFDAPDQALSNALRHGAEVLLDGWLEDDPIGRHFA